MGLHKEAAESQFTLYVTGCKILGFDFIVAVKTYEHVVIGNA